MSIQNRTGLLKLIKRALQDIGYTGNLIQENYKFTNFLGQDFLVDTIPLAAFAQEPPSYRNACIGVVHANGASGAPLVDRYRSLGAPQILEIHEHHLCRWKMSFQDSPVLLEKVEVAKAPSLIASNRLDWSPIRIMNAKSNPGSVPIQLDFFDLELLPLLDKEVRRKLDILLQETVALSLEEFQRSARFLPDHYPPLFRLLFRLFFAKVLADRNYPGEWLADDPRVTLRLIQENFFKDLVPEPILEHSQTQHAAWEKIRSGFYFQNLSVDSLAYAYENTLVAKKTRKLYGIHSTPPEVAEYILRQLPIEDLEQDQRRIFEPFAGHAVFLVAAIQRLRELLPPDMPPAERHCYFIEMLSGIEIDDFAREVARLSLMLADYPFPDGWRLHKGDAFVAQAFQREIRSAKVVLCNPPFEDFTPEERARYPSLSIHKPLAILNQVLQRPPEALGFVLPRIFATGRAYRQLRLQIGQMYSSIELLALPDSIFQHSRSETVLLMAFQKGGQKPAALRTGEVFRKDLSDFYLSQKPSYQSEGKWDSSLPGFAGTMWLPQLSEVWTATSHMKRLGELADIHRGIEYNLPFQPNEKHLVAKEKRKGFKLGVHRAKDSVEPFHILNRVFLNVSEELIRTSAHNLAWNSPKIIVNAHRRMRSRWKITASPDYSGLVCYRNFHGIWPSKKISLEVLSAILNGPVANAFVSELEGMRHVGIHTLQGIPVPPINPNIEQAIAFLVHEYEEVREQWISQTLPNAIAQTRCKRLLQLIDAEVLRAYDLPPRIERSLLNFFSGHTRPGPVKFTEYFPESFKPYVPWHRFLSGELEEATAKATLSRLDPIDDPLISEAMEDLHINLQE